jgi:predicted Zn-dependent peptidase
MQSWNLAELAAGERVITERLDYTRSAALGYWIGAGSRDETDDKAGVSHFIEHLLFKGTPNHTALDIAEIFDGIGSELNAATSREHTLVFAHVPAAHVELALNVMSEMVFDPLFDDLDSERDVVLEEIAMYEDTPQDLVHDLIAEAIFGSHPLGRPIIGTTEVISTVSQRVISDYHRAMYRPSNIVFAAAGDVDHEQISELVSAAAQRRAAMTDGKPKARAPLVDVPEPGLRFQKKDTEQYHVCLGAPGISRSDPLRFAASVLDAILGGSASSRLFQEIREKRGMAYSVYSFASQHSETGQIGIYLGTREENLSDGLAIAVEQIGDIAAGNVLPRELDRAKENLKGRVVLSMESTSTHMNRLGKSLVTGSEILSFEEVIARVDAVEVAQVCDLAASLLAPTRLSAAGIGPNEERFLEAVERVTPTLSRAA